MNFYKKRKPFISLICAISLIFSMINVPVAAADTNSVTATTSATVRQGNSAYCYVNIDSTEGLAALDVTIHYDPAKVKITGVYNSVSCTLYDSVTNTNTIQFSYILDGQGTASKTRLFYFQYQVLSNADVGSAYFDITIGEAYDNSLNEMTVSGSRCSFTIAETVTNKSCNVYGSSSISTAIEQEFTLSYRFSTYQIASGTAVVTYDSDLFEVAEVTQGAFLTGKVVDINTDLTGEIYVSFVGTEYYSNTNLVTVTFRTIKNVTETSKITLKTTELLDKELNSISCSGYTTNVNVVYDETHTGDSPAMRLDGTFSYEDKQITLVVSLEAGSNLGAGDFVITFDPELVSYNSCTKGFSPSFFNINDKNVEAGELKFHIISLSDIVTEETVLTVVFDVNYPYGCETADFTIEGTGLTDSLTESILLNFIDDSVWLEYQVTFRDADGALLQSSMYHYGDTVQEPDAPIKESDVYGTYTFSGWDKQVMTCTADATYTATYSLEYTDYTVIFQDWDGTELSKETYHYGDTIIAPTAPTRVADSTYTYAFAGWDKELTCTGNMTITAVYKPTHIEYTVVFKDWDGTELSKQTYHYGEAITAPANPTKAADNTYTYAFSGWDKELTCTGNMTITAVYIPTHIEYTVVFQDWDGTELSKQTYHYGEAITAPANPTKVADNTYTYAFSGWDKELTCTGNMTITAVYIPTHIEYTVVFQDWDGTELSKDTYHYGEVITAPAEPTKAADSTYAYAFSGWDKELICTGNMIITAEYEVGVLESISISTKPNKRTYIESTILDDTGMVLTLYYSNGVAETVTTGWVSEYDFSTVGTATVKVTYGEKECTYDVTVIAKTLTHIAIESKPGKQTYLEGDEFEQKGMAVTAYYNDDTSEVVTAYTVAGYTSTPGIKTITVSYEGKTATFTVVVNHNYSTTMKDATLNANGSIIEKCSICGHVKSSKTIYKISSVSLSTTAYTYNGAKKTPSVTVKDSKGKKLVDGTDYSVSYSSSSRKSIGRYSVKITFKGNYTGSKTLYFTIGPKNPSSVTAKLYGHDDVKVSWKKVSGASGYKVYYKKSTSSTWSSKTTTGTSVKLANLSDGVKYDIKVVTYKTVKGNKCYNAGKTTSIYTLKKVAGVKVAKSGSKVKVSWTNISGETGYQISKSTKKSGTSIVLTYKTTSGKSKTISATKGKNYYYKVRAYKVVDGKKIYGPWSSVIKYKR